MSEKFVVIGGDAAGMSAASKAKRENPELDVTVFEKGEWVSYGACGLPYYVKGDVDSLEDLVAIPADKFREKRDIDLRTNHEVTKIDPEKESVLVESEEETLEKKYDHLLIATGARAVSPPIDGRDLEGVFKLHRLPSGKEIRDHVENSNPNSVGIIGGGYIGAEMAEAFSARGLEVHIFEMLPHVLDNFSEETSETVEEHLKEKGIELHLGEKIDRLTGKDGKVTGAEKEDGSVNLDMVLLASGISPNTELAEEAGIELGPTGAIATDEYGRTNYSNIYAAGDCAEAENIVTNSPDYVPLALTANRHGRAIGQTVGGNPEPGGPIAGTAVVKVFDLEVARTGIVRPERAKDAGFDPISKTITAQSRAHYYPGGHPIKITLTADKDTKRVLGASMAGKDGVSKRIDPIATALYSSLTVPELEKLDLAYAPPFSPVWDPVLTAARVLNGKLD